MPSEKTVKQVITPIVIFNLMALPSNGIIREIQQRFLSIKNTLRKQADNQHSIDQAAYGLKHMIHIKIRSQFSRRSLYFFTQKLLTREPFKRLQYQRSRLS